MDKHGRPCFCKFYLVYTFDRIGVIQLRDFDAPTFFIWNVRCMQNRDIRFEASITVPVKGLYSHNKITKHYRPSFQCKNIEVMILGYDILIRNKIGWNNDEKVRDRFNDIHFRLLN
jgi:hypothetical protein